MTRNDTFFKILFAIEVALLPLVMACYVLTKNSGFNWVPGLIVAGVLAVKIWMEIFRNKQDNCHLIINSIGNVLSVGSLVIFFTVVGYINVVVCVFVVALAVLTNLLQVVLKDRVMPEMISAVDSCYMLFECLLFAGLTFVVFYGLVTDIALFALLLTSSVSVTYKSYYLCRHYSVFDRIKNLFRRR